MEDAGDEAQEVVAMRLSIIIPYLNSHEIVRRHLVHLSRMGLPDDVEVLFMDDGSDPPLQTPRWAPKNFAIHSTNERRPWTSSIARNKGAKLAKGEYYLMTDGDYIITRQAIMHAREFDGDRLGFRREFGVLNKHGDFQQDRETLLAYGLPAERYDRKGTKMPPHPNNFVMRREVFDMIGGYDEQLILSRPYPQGEDRHFKRALMKLASQGRVKLPDTDDRSTIYMYPNGQFCGDVDYNPFGLFHTLTRKTPENHWFRNPLGNEY